MELGKKQPPNMKRAASLRGTSVFECAFGPAAISSPLKALFSRFCPQAPSNQDFASAFSWRPSVFKILEKPRGRGWGDYYSANSTERKPSDFVYFRQNKRSFIARCKPLHRFVARCSRVRRNKRSFGLHVPLIFNQNKNALLASMWTRSIVQAAVWNS
jgi:hypothetical protein